MKNSVRIVLLTAAMAVALAPSAFAQFDLGVRAGFDIEAEDPFVGVEARIALPVGNLPLMLQPSFDYFITGDGGDGIGGVGFDYNVYQIDVNVLYPFGVNNESFTPYAGVGLGITYWSFDYSGLGVNADDSETDIGLNIVGGAMFGSGNLRPFAQARFMLGGGELFSLMGGVLFRFGG